MSVTNTSLLFQFTPLREGRRNGKYCVHDPVLISIHAPPRGATGNGVELEDDAMKISIHAPPRGATRPFVGAFLLRNHFNSRPSARGDTSPSPIR